MLGLLGLVLLAGLDNFATNSPVPTRPDTTMPALATVRKTNPVAACNKSMGMLVLAFDGVVVVELWLPHMVDTVQAACRTADPSVNVTGLFQCSKCAAVALLLLLLLDNKPVFRC